MTLDTNKCSYQVALGSPAVAPSVLFVVAMHDEAAPLVEALDAAPAGSPVWAARLPTRLFRARRGEVTVHLAWAGRDPLAGVDAIGTVPAAVTTLVGIAVGRPDLVVSAGTAGGFGERGARIGDVVMAWDRFVFHDRRIPLGPFETYGTGNLPAADLRRLARRRGWRLGPVTTGDSLDATDLDRAAMAASGAEAKEMEAAAVARVAYWHRIPVTALKAVTDLVDHPVDTAQQFAANLHRAVEALQGACVALVDAIAAEGIDAWAEEPA